MTVTETQVMEALGPVQDPELRRSIVDLGMVRGIHIDGGRVEVQIAVTSPGCPTKAEIQQAVGGAVLLLDGVEAAKVDFTVMTDEQMGELRERLHGDPSATAGTNSTYGHSEGRAVPFAEANSRTRVLLIASGKGGVGKSSMTTNLAVALAARDRDVAVVDADVWGFSIPRMLGVSRPPTVIDGMLIPPEAHGVRCISMGFFADEDQPVIWRGPMLHKALEQFLTPGTGDISISLAGFLPTAEMYVVTTPQAVAQTVAQRAAFMAEKVNLKVHGIIENMSWFTGDDGTRYELFGAGGGQALADRLGVPLIGQVPLVPALRDGSDNGRPVAADPSTEVGALFAEIARTIDVDMKPTRRRHKELKII